MRKSSLGVDRSHHLRRRIATRDYLNPPSAPHQRGGAQERKRGRRGFRSCPGIDLDVNTEDENNGGPTYAAVTARSYHPGGVNAVFLDGSVRFIKDSINWMTWRALGTIASGEVISSDGY